MAQRGEEVAAFRRTLPPSDENKKLRRGSTHTFPGGLSDTLSDHIIAVGYHSVYSWPH